MNTLVDTRETTTATKQTSALISSKYFYPGESLASIPEATTPWRETPRTTTTPRPLCLSMFHLIDSFILVD